MKKCKHCKNRLWFWNRQVAGYHNKCALPAYAALKEYLHRIKYVPFSTGTKTKPVTMKQYKQLEKDLEVLRKFVLQKVIDYAERDNK